MPNFFLSHVQNERGNEAGKFYAEVEKQNLGTCWLDVYAADKTPKGMKEGVMNCDIFVAIVSESYVHREFCQMELRAAQEYEKPVFVLIQMTDKANISKFAKASPPAFKWLFDINFNNIDVSDMEMFVQTLPILLKRATDAAPAPPLAAGPTVTWVTMQGKLPTNQAAEGRTFPNVIDGQVNITLQEAMALCEANPSVNALVVDPRHSPPFYHAKGGFTTDTSFKAAGHNLYYIKERTS